MIEDLTYPRAELPRELEIQVLAFMRIVWSDVFHGDERLRTRLWEDEAAMHFVRADGDLLVSHAQVVVPHVSHDGRPLRIAGVGGVMTYPQFRGEGHGMAVIRRTTEHIRSSTAFDIGMLFCDPGIVPFYERFGWTLLPAGRVVATHDEPEDAIMTVGDTTVLPDVLRLGWSW
jgi:predicted acetyltransferase